MTNLQDGVRESEMERVSSARPALQGGAGNSRFQAVPDSERESPGAAWALILGFPPAW